MSRAASIASDARSLIASVEEPASPVAFSLKSRLAANAWSARLLAAFAAFSKGAPLLSVFWKVWSAMVAHSVGILSKRVLRLESGGDGAFRNAPHPSSKFLRGIVQRIGREALGVGLP